MNTRRTTAEIIISGKNVTETVSKYLKAISWTDNLSGEADTAEIELADREQLWLKDWFPVRGDTAKITLVKQNWSNETETLPLGTFEIDEITNSYPPNTAKIKLNSVSNNSNLRSVNKSKAWEKVYLSKIAGEIASEAGLTLFYDTADDPYIERAEQKEQSKLSFLMKLCRDNGLALKVSDEKIIIFDEAKFESQAEVSTLQFGGSDIKSFSGTATISKIYSSCKVTYKHGKKNEKIEFEYKDSSKSGGMTLEINKKVENQGEAEKLAKKELREKNKEEIKVRLSVVGDFVYCAGNVIKLNGFGFYDGRYIIEKATHNIGGGYECSLEVRKCLSY